MIHNRSKSKFKKLGLARAFDLWSGGHPAEFIPALRSCEASDVSDDRNIRKRFSDLKKLMERLEADLQSTDSFIENPTEEQLAIMFGKISANGLLLGEETPTGKKRRGKQLAWTSYRRAQFKKSKTNYCQ